MSLAKGTPQQLAQNTVCWMDGHLRADVSSVSPHRNSPFAPCVGVMKDGSDTWLLGVVRLYSRLSNAPSRKTKDHSMGLPAILEQRHENLL